MNEIYWITRLDMINIWLIIFSVIGGVIMVVSTILYIVGKSDYDESMISMYDIGYMIRIKNIVNSAMISSVQAAQSERTRERMAEISSSSSSSGGGFGGGFSSGGGYFGGGGCGVRF